MGMDFNILNIDPVAFAIGPLVVRWYALAYMAGFLLGWKYCLRLVLGDADARPNVDDIDNFLTWAVIGVILGGRIGYVLFYQLDFYLYNPSEIYKIWHGGMSFHGGVLGVMFSMMAYSIHHKVSLFKLSDVVCAAAPIGLFFGRLANFINGELVGKPTSVPWGVVFKGEDFTRHPSQLYEAMLEGVVLFLILYAIKRYTSLKAGTVSGVFLIGYGIFRAGVEFVREPDVQIGLIGGFISMGQVLCLPMILGGFILIFYANRKDV